MHSRPWRKAIWRLTVVGVLLAALALSCARPAPTPEPVTIRFAHLDTDAAYYQKLAARFSERYPSITLQLLPLDWHGIFGLQATDADVFVTQYTQERREKGDILSLDSWMAGDQAFNASDYYPGTLEIFGAEGKTWGIPAWVDPMVMYYNKDLFDQRHVPYPQNGWTWDDFLATAQALSDPVAGIYGYAYDPYGVDFALFIDQHGGKLVDDWLNPTRLTLDDPKTEEGLEWYAQLIHLYHVAPTPEEAQQAFGSDDGSSFALGILTGRVGMWTGAHSGAGQALGEPWSFHWGVVTLPRESRASTIVTVDALAISSQAQHPDTCWQWISFLSREMPNRSVPARRSLLESSAYEKQVGTEVAATDRAALQGAVRLAGYRIPAEFEQAWQALQEAVVDVYAGRATAQEALTLAQQEVGRQ